MSKKIRELLSLPLMLLVVATSFLRFAGPIRAEEIVISGNGDSSTNTAAVSVETQTTITQNNQGNVQNNVDQTAATGGNTASQNTGGNVAITTGDSNLTSAVENTFNNSSVDSGTCCGLSDFTVNISGNGSDSENSIAMGVSQENGTYVSQNAYIGNYIEGTGITGRNSADGNTGTGVSISTGDITARGRIINGPVNTSAVVSGNPAFNFSAIIAENGTGSKNTLAASFYDPQNVIINNNFEARNKMIWNLVTGENHADGNTGGNVTITTGNIFLDLWIQNSANNSTVDIACCHNVTPPPPPPGGCGDPGCETPIPPGSSGGGGGGGGGGGSSSGPSVLGLSFTGSQTETGIVTIAGLAMIIAGLFVIYGKKETIPLFA